MAATAALAGAVWAQTPKYPIRAPAGQEAQGKVPEKGADKKGAAPKGGDAQPDESWTEEARKKSIEIGTQPARDVGVMKREIPPILVTARDDPYSLKGLKTCKQLAAEVTRLNEVLGPDYTVGNELKENKAGKLAEAGGKSVVNAIIPFRGIVRELTGAAPADRRMNAAVDAGLARRGFLRGVHAKQGCRTTF
ncbi:MAG: hypothetical protein J7521_06175 [Caulobacter sp.]|nr:hypothetical protein [Caulobacter sp.]